MSTNIAERGELLLTQFSGGMGRPMLLQVNGPAGEDAGWHSYVHLTVDDADWLSSELAKWVAQRQPEGAPIMTAYFPRGGRPADPDATSWQQGPTGGYVRGRGPCPVCGIRAYQWGRDEAGGESVLRCVGCSTLAPSSRGPRQVGPHADVDGYRILVVDDPDHPDALALATKGDEPAHAVALARSDGTVSLSFRVGRVLPAAVVLALLKVAGVG